MKKKQQKEKGISTGSPVSHYPAHRFLFHLILCIQADSSFLPSCIKCGMGERWRM